MGFPFFTWWPHQSRVGTSRQTITFTEGLSDLQITPRRDVIDTYALDGGRKRELLRPYMDVRIVLERYTDRGLFRDLNSMINHLERGGTVAFGTDSAKAWACKLQTDIAPKTKLFKIGPNLTTMYHEDSASTVPTTLDEITIESSPPLAKRESHIIKGISSHTATHTTISIDDSNPDIENFTFDYFPENSLVRFSDFFPTLIQPASGVGAQVNTHDHRISYTLDITLTYIIPRLEVDIPNQYSGTTVNLNDQPQYNISTANTNPSTNPNTN